MRWLRCFLMAQIVVAWAGVGCSDPEANPEPDAAVVVDAGADVAEDDDADAKQEPDAGDDEADAASTGDGDAGAGGDSGADAELGEICDDGSDDDGDGAIDCADGDCEDSPSCLASAISVRRTHACMAVADGSVRCWGENDFGQLGAGEIDYGVPVARVTPVKVVGIEDAVDVEVGKHFSCVLHADATVSCWGQNDSGQLGDGSRVTSPAPVQVTGLSDVEEISAGEEFACARTSDGAVYCWGANAKKQLGDGTEEARQTPVRVQQFALVTATDLDEVTEISCGWGHCCAVRSDARAWCWGSNEGAALGSGTSGESLASAGAALPVRGADSGDILTQIEAIDAGAGHTCAARADGTVWCWGVAPNFAPPQSDDGAVAFDGLSDVETIWASRTHSCALRSAGTLACWGSGNVDGEYGLGEATVQTATPALLPDVQGPSDVSLGHSVTCLIDGTGVPWCTGYNSAVTVAVEGGEEGAEVNELTRVIW